MWNTWGEYCDSRVGYFTSSEVGVVLQQSKNKRYSGIKVLTSSGVIGWISASYVVQVHK